MTKQTINVGTSPNDNRGDSLRASFQKINANFTELYTALGINADVNLNLGAFEFAGSVLSTTDSSAIVIDQAVTVSSNLTVGGDVLPSVANGGDLGSSARPWKSLYISNNTIYIGGTAVGLDANGNLTTGGTVVGSTPAWANITGKPSFATVATTGAYADLTGKPSIPADVSDLTDTTSLLGSGSASWPVTNTAGASGPALIAIGQNAGLTSQSESAVAIGVNAGLTTQGDSAVAIGRRAGETTQGQSAVAIGEQAGMTTQGASAVAVGLSAGFTGQGARAVAIGWEAGYTGQGVSAVAIGQLAGVTNQAANSIIINATGSALNQTTASTFTVAPIRNASGTNGVLQYNAATKEVTYSNEITVNSNTWTFGTDGSLTIPGDIRSDSNINIDINLSDSTLRRWQFGEDGELTLPADAVVKNTSGNLTIKGQSYVFIDSASNGQINIGTSSGVGAVVLGSKSRGTNVVVDDLQVANGVYEYFSSLTDATGVVTHNCSNGHIFYHTSPDANWTVNLTNLLDTWNRSTSVTLIIAQGVTGYIPNAVQIAGVAQTIKWRGVATPTPSTSRTDVVTFSIINVSGTYTVLGQLTGF